MRAAHLLVDAQLLRRHRRHGRVVPKDPRAVRAAQIVALRLRDECSERSPARRKDCSVLHEERSRGREFAAYKRVRSNPFTVFEKRLLIDDDGQDLIERLGSGNDAYDKVAAIQPADFHRHPDMFKRHFLKTAAPGGHPSA